MRLEYKKYHNGEDEGGGGGGRGRRGISRQTRIVSSFFLSFKDKRKKQSGNKRSAKKCFPESLRNFKVCFNPFLQWEWDVLEEVTEGRRLAIITVKSLFFFHPKKRKNNYGMRFKSACRLRNSELWIWIQLQSKTSSGLTARTLPENPQDGLGRRRRNTSSLCTMCHQVVKSRNCTRDHRRQERVKTPDHYNWWATFSSYVDEW